jgi:hypothetical protein
MICPKNDQKQQIFQRKQTRNFESDEKNIEKNIGKIIRELIYLLIFLCIKNHLGFRAIDLPA